MKIGKPLFKETNFWKICMLKFWKGYLIHITGEANDLKSGITGVQGQSNWEEIVEDGT